MLSWIFNGLYDSVYIAFTFGFIYHLSLLIQKIVFLEYHEPKQDRRIRIGIAISSVSIAVIKFIEYLLGDVTFFWIVAVILGFVILVIYSGFTGRKKAKWLAVFEILPIYGCYIGFESIMDLCLSGLKNRMWLSIAYMCSYGVLLVGLHMLEVKKPIFIQKLESDIENRSLSIGEELVIWGMGLWLVLEDVLEETIVSNSTFFINAYIQVLNFLVVILVVTFVISSNYREYSNKKNIELQKSLVAAMDEMEKRSISTLLALTRAIEAKDRYTKGHSARVAQYSKMIAERMGKTEEEQEEIYNVGLLHDVGKLRVPEEIINKEGKLTDAEFEYIKLHPVAGYNILRDIHGDNQLSVGAKFHHERYDGTGYPNGLEGENIPELARIIAVADSYDAMASNRSYRKALPQEVIRAELEKGMGTQFDPKIAKVMLQIMEEDKEYQLRETEQREKTILVVDDSNINLRIAEKILTKEPAYRVLKAMDGEEAIDVLSKNSVDLILLDIEMPGMDGFETLSKIREFSKVAVIFMTADKELTTINRAVEMGVEDYITKPFTGPELLESVYGALAR